MLDIKLEINKIIDERPDFKDILSRSEKDQLISAALNSDDKAKFLSQLRFNLIEASELKSQINRLEKDKSKYRDAMDRPGNINDIDNFRKQLIIDDGKKSHPNHNQGYSEVFHTILPQDRQRVRNLNDISRELLAAQNRNRNDRKSLIDSGYFDEEKKYFGRRVINSVGSFLNNTSKILSGGAETLGFLSTPSEYDSRYQKYINHRNQLLSNIAYKLNPDSYPLFLKYLNDYDRTFEKAYGALDHECFKKMQDLLNDDLIKDGNGEHNKKLTKLKDDLNQANDSMLTNMDRIKADEAAMWKFRALQLFLLLSPFGLTSILGIVDYIDFFGHIFGPLFDGALDLGQGMEEAISNHWGFVGDIMEAFRLDEFGRILFNDIPVIGDITGLVNLITDTQMGQLFISGAGNLLDMDVMLFMIAGGYSIYRLSEEFKHKDSAVDKPRGTKGNREVLDDIVEGFKKDDNSQYAQKRLSTLQFIYSIQELVIFLKDLDLNNNIIEIFKDIKFLDCKGQGQTLKEALTKGNLSDILDKKNQDPLQQAIKTHLILKNLSRGDIRKDDNLQNKYNIKIKDKQAVSQIVQQEYERSGNQFLIDYFSKNINDLDHLNVPSAQDKLKRLNFINSRQCDESRGSYSHEFSRDIASLKSKFIERDCQEMDKLSSLTILPSSSVRLPKESKLFYSPRCAAMC